MVLTGDLQHQPKAFFVAFNLDYDHLLVRTVRPLSSKKQDFILKNKDLTENALFFLRLSVMNGFYIFKPPTMANRGFHEFFKITSKQILILNA